MNGYILATKEELEEIMQRQISFDEWSRFCYYLDKLTSETFKDALEYMTDRRDWDNV